MLAPRAPQIRPIIRSNCYACCAFNGQTIGERVLSTIQLMLLICPMTRLNCYACCEFKGSDHRRESCKHNPADAHDARPAGSLNLSNHWSNCYACCEFYRRESCKHNPADTHDARPAGSLNLSNDSFELQCQLWVQRPDNRRQGFEHNPAESFGRTAMPAVRATARPSAREFYTQSSCCS